MKFSDQVKATLKGLHPGARKDIRRALDDVNTGKKRDVIALKGVLTGYARLRVGRYRVVFRYDGAGVLLAEFLETRAAVYRNFQP